MAKIFGVNTKISGKVGQLLYRQTKAGTIVSELPLKPATPLRTQRQMNIRAQWSNLGAIYKQFDAMLRKGFEELPPNMNVYNAFIQANLSVVRVYITKTMRLNDGAILAPYQITRGSLPSIQGYLETVLTHPDISDEMRQQFLVQCFGQAQRLTSILQDMATLNKIDAAPMTYKFEEVNISQIVEQVLDASALQLEEHRMRFDNQLPATLMARADASLVHSIFRNLTDNAISYAGDGTTITLTHSCTDNHWQFTFSGNGVGIPAEHLSRIFERFYRVDKGRSRKLGGTGLGLAIVKNAVQLHGGMIAAFQNKDGGVRFVFTIR